MRDQKKLDTLKKKLHTDDECECVCVCVLIGVGVVVVSAFLTFLWAQRLALQ